MLEVRYMTDIHGKRFVVASPEAPVGYEWNGVIYDTAFEAAKAEGAMNQRVYFDERYNAAREALEGILYHVCPAATYHWDDQEEQRDKNALLALDIMNALFPTYRARTDKHDHYAVTFLDEIAKAEAVYQEIHTQGGA